MKLTDGEKLILLMLSEVYEKLGLQGNLDHKFIESAILEDQLWGLSWHFSGIPFETSSIPPVVSEVCNILDMWNYIESSFERLSNESKKKVEDNVKPFGKNPRFDGFDGNNESLHLSTADFLINKLKRFQNFKDRDLNSHIPSIDSYSRMLSVFANIKRKLSNDDLSVDQIIEILKEQIHPDNRR